MDGFACGEVSCLMPYCHRCAVFCLGNNHNARGKLGSLSLSSLQHIMIDLGTGNNNKINWAMTDKQEFIDIVETVYRGARKGRGLVVSPKDYSTKYRY